MRKTFGYIKAYIKSMRLYYSFITGIAGWIGLAFYEFWAVSSPERTIELAPSLQKKLVILGLLFLSWGLNQIINDFLGRKEDAINAPARPMVTGELPAIGALIASLVLLSAAAILIWFYLEPLALVFMFAGVLLNVIYEWAKGYGILGNIVFGLMITTATLFGASAAGPSGNTIFAPQWLSIPGFVFLLNAVMTYYTYFKDYAGDKAAGKKTLVVKFGPMASRRMALGGAFLPIIAFMALYIGNALPLPLNRTFVILGILTVFLQLWTGILYFRHPVGDATYTSLRKNFQACACGQAALLAFFNPELAMGVFITAYIFVEFLFNLHTNPRS